MQQVQLFTDREMISLQAQINDWLAGHPEIDILSTNLCALSRVSELPSDAETEGAYAFYIRYDTLAEGQQESMLSELQQPLPAEMTAPHLIQREAN